jgi:hypothetical protein
MWIHEDGSIYGVGKVKIPNPKYDGSKEFNHQFHYLQAVRGPSIFGPYTRLHAEGENALPENYENEDPCIWYDGARYHVLVTDLHGYATGLRRGFTYYTSENGLNYELVSKDPLFSMMNPIRFDDGSEIKFARVERPNVVLNEQGEVMAVLAACLPVNNREGARILVFPVNNRSCSGY